MLVPGRDNRVARNNALAASDAGTRTAPRRAACGHHGKVRPHAVDERHQHERADAAQQDCAHEAARGQASVDGRNAGR